MDVIGLPPIQSGFTLAGTSWIEIIQVVPYQTSVDLAENSGVVIRDVHNVYGNLCKAHPSDNRIYMVIPGVTAISVVYTLEFFEVFGSSLYSINYDLDKYYADTKTCTLYKSGAVLLPDGSWGDKAAAVGFNPPYFNFEPTCQINYDETNGFQIIKNVMFGSDSASKTVRYTAHIWGTGYID